MGAKEERRQGLSALFRFGGREESGGAEMRRVLEINRALASELEPRRLYAKILDAAIELTGAGSKLDAFLNAIERGAILETVRTGASGIGRGDRVLKV